MNQEQTWLLKEKYNGLPTVEFYDDLKRLEAGEPLAYIIGWMPFCGAKIYLDSKPLIPRPETEFWTARAIEQIKDRENPKVLDLCAGSGCIGVSVLRAIPGSTVDFVEIEERHRATILKNVAENGINSNRTKVINGSLFDNIADTYDMILTNPPYIDPDLKGRIQQSVLNYEPERALFGGPGGMELITEILEKAPQFLNDNGILFIEHEPEQAGYIQHLLPDIHSYPDQFGVIRFSIYQKQ